MKKLQIKILLGYALASAVVYSVAAGYFIYCQSYVQSWVLYLGNFLFGITIALFLYRFYKRSNYTMKIGELVMSGQVISIAGIIISCLLCLVLIGIFVPEVFHKIPENNALLHNAPTQLQQGNNSYVLLLFMDAVFGNIGTGSFIAILFPFTIARYKKK